MSAHQEIRVGCVHIHMGMMCGEGRRDLTASAHSDPEIILSTRRNSPAPSSSCSTVTSASARSASPTDVATYGIELNAHKSVPNIDAHVRSP